jgi:hypothetical protein
MKRFALVLALMLGAFGAQAQQVVNQTVTSAPTTVAVPLFTNPSAVNTVAITASGGATGLAFTFQASTNSNGSNPITLDGNACVNQPGIAPASGLSGDGSWRCNVAGYAWFGIVVSAETGGSETFRVSGSGASIAARSCPVVGSGTFANRPSGVPACAQYFATDLGTGVMIAWNGTNWKPVGGRATIANIYANASVPADTSEHDLADFAVPAGLVSNKGRLVITAYWLTNSNANAKFGRTRFGTASTGVTNAIVGSVSWGTAVAQYTAQSSIEAQNATNAQISTGSSNNSFGGGGGAYVTTAIDMTAVSYINLTGQLAVSSDTQTLVMYMVDWIESRLIPSNDNRFDAAAPEFLAA